jgi:branched-chain amino acid aminotransferase
VTTPTRDEAGDVRAGSVGPAAAGIQALVWIDGQRTAVGSAHVSVHDRGLTLADGVFETMHVRGLKAFRLDRHLARLRQGLSVLEMPVPSELDAWVLGALGDEGVRPPGAPDASLRVTVTRGVGPPGLGVPAEVEPTVIVSVSPMPTFAAIHAKGLVLHVASGRRNERAMTAGLKTLAYTDAVAGLLEARHAGADEALFLDTEGHCSEATASNLFAWSGVSLMTPPLSCGVLPGVTREAVLELARAQGLAVAERAFGFEELRAAGEVFLTSSLRRVAPVVRIGEHVVGSGKPGPLTARLIAAYDMLVDRECGA